MHPDTARRRTEAAGAVLVAHETAEAARVLRAHPAAPCTPDTLVLSIDGAMVPLLHGAWTEVRTLAVGEVIEREQRRQVVRQRQRRRTERHTARPAAPPPQAEPVSVPPPAPPPRLVEPEAKPPHLWKRDWSVQRQRELAGAA